MKEQKEALEQLEDEWNEIKNRIEEEEPLGCTFGS